jgi:hypothetical protein
MNTKQAAKYAQIKAQLMAMSFDWIDGATYSRNGQSVYQGSEVFFSSLDHLTGDAPLYTLTVKGPVLCLVHGDKSCTIGFLNEYNTDNKSVQKQAEEIDAKVRSLLK